MCILNKSPPSAAYVDGILPKGPYPPCLRMADMALLAGYPRCVNEVGQHWFQGSKFHSSDLLRRVKMTVGQVKYRQDLSHGRLRISDFHIGCIGFIYFRQVNGTFGQVIFTIHLPDGQVHSIWNFEAWVWIMACRLFSAKLLPEPMLIYSQLDPLRTNCIYNFSEILINVIT